MPNSPERNLLDLGVWRSMQAAVVRLCCFRQRHDPEVLAARVQDVWDAFPCSTIEKVYKRWELVLDLILKGDGSNRFVELHRGKLTNDPLVAAPEDEDNTQAEIWRAVRNVGGKSGNEEDEENDEDDDDGGFYNDINLAMMDIELFGGNLGGGMEDDGGDIDILADSSVLL